MRSTQRRQTRQWCARGGLCRPHFWQKRTSPLCAASRGSQLLAESEVAQLSAALHVEYVAQHSQGVAVRHDDQEVLWPARAHRLLDLDNLLLTAGALRWLVVLWHPANGTLGLSGGAPVLAVTSAEKFGR